MAALPVLTRLLKSGSAPGGYDPAELRDWHGRWAFHVAPSSARSAIESGGLASRNPDLPHVHAFQDEKTARAYAGSMAGLRSEGPQDVYRVDTKGLDPKEAAWEYFGAVPVQVRGPVPPSRLKRLSPAPDENAAAPPPPSDGPDLEELREQLVYFRERGEADHIARVEDEIRRAR